MKKGMIFLMILVIFFSIFSVSAETNKQDIIIETNIKEVYNLGDRIPISLKISSTVDVTSNLKLEMVCDGHKMDLMNMNNFYIPSAERKEITYTLSLDNMQGYTGSCKIKGIYGDDYTTKEFDLTDELKVSVEEISETVKPKKNLIIKGEVLKQNPSSDGFDGFYSIDFNIDSITEKEQGMVENGFFKVNFTIPHGLAAGKYNGNILVFDKDKEGEKANKGETGFEFNVAQIPTNLEIVAEKEVKPGNEIEIKTILHDQTGKNIPKNVTITIRDSSGKIIKMENRQTKESLEIEIPKNEKQGEWNITAISKNMKTQSKLKILKNKETEVRLINKTVLIKNVGNVPYNGTVSVKISNETIDVPTSLGLGENKKYHLSAPEGNYTVEIVADGEKRVTKNIQLTGKAIDVKDSLSGNLISNPIVWGFVIIVLGIVLYIVFKKGYKRSFFGRKIKHKDKNKEKEKKKSKEDKEKKKQDKATEAMNQGILPHYDNKAALSLSIKGNKQDANLICLKINNYDEIKKDPQTVKETFHKIIKTAEHSKAYIYESNGNIFFIFAPEITRTFKNEKTAIQTAKKIEEDLRKHNKHFKQRIDFGLSVNRGEIIVKKEKKEMKFMSVGKLTTSAKKIASMAKGETLLTKEMNEKLGPEIKTEKGEDKENKIEFYRIKEIKDRTHNQKFLQEFVKRYKKDGQEK